MSFKRQSPPTPADERFLIIRTLVAECAPGLRTTSPTKGWHRLVSAATGAIIVRTPHGDWSAPTRHAIWVPSGAHAELEMCGKTAMQLLYIRDSKAAWCREPLPAASQPVSVDSLLHEIIASISQVSMLDRRVAWHLSMATLLLHKVREGAVAPTSLLWPRDPRAARIATLLQTDPSDIRDLNALRGPGRECSHHSTRLSG